jgi:hypothetical protein
MNDGRRPSARRVRRSPSDEGRKSIVAKILQKFRGLVLICDRTGKDLQSGWNTHRVQLMSLVVLTQASTVVSDATSTLPRPALGTRAAGLHRRRSPGEAGLPAMGTQFSPGTNRHSISTVWRVAGATRGSQLGIWAGRRARVGRGRARDRPRGLRRRGRTVWVHRRGARLWTRLPITDDSVYGAPFTSMAQFQDFVNAPTAGSSHFFGATLCESTR